MRKLVLWGHRAAEYQAMFALSPTEMQQPLLEWGCGASAVNATLNASGGSVVSVDPLFTLGPESIAPEVLARFNTRAAEVSEEPNLFDLQSYGGLEGFLAERRAGVELFLADYAQGLREERYMPMNAGRLSFAAGRFAFALSSHFLFADAATQSVAGHINTISELARVASEVRLFPLIDRIGHVSPLLGPVLLGLQQANFGVEVRQVSYSLYPEGNAMLRVRAKQCVV